MKKYLIVIDMQNDFIDGSLGNADAVSIVPAVVEEIKKDCYDGIFATYDTHYEDYLQSAEGKKLPVEHCIKGTPGWELNKEIQAALPENTRLIEKPTFGSWELAELAADLGEEKELEFYLCGLCTDICVISNAMLLKAKLPEAKIAVIAHACAGVSPQSHENALAAMSCCQIDII
ncbi:MAG: cysteine hydrolase [Firmicutes bacterium]|nr:cysteine hydrolase [Bacillota bacterium]